MAEFKTAKGQYILPLNVAVIGSAALKTGDLVILTAAASGKPDSIAKTTDLNAATHMIALSDDVFTGVGTDQANYLASDEVAVTAATLSTTSPVKKVGLYPLFDKGDVIV